MLGTTPDDLLLPPRRAASYQHSRAAGLLKDLSALEEAEGSSLFVPLGGGDP